VPAIHKGGLLEQVEEENQDGTS